MIRPGPPPRPRPGSPGHGRTTTPAPATTARRPAACGARAGPGSRLRGDAPGGRSAIGRHNAP